jgi:hypothetical protein
MDSLQNLPFHDHPSNGQSFQTVSVSNQSLIDLLNGKLAGSVDKIGLSSDQIREIIQGLQEPRNFRRTNEPESFLGGMSMSQMFLKHDAQCNEIVRLITRSECTVYVLGNDSVASKAERAMETA